jgi:hypothetical protein
MQWCDEQINVFMGEMVVQGGSDWHGEFTDPTGLLDNLLETRKTACSILNGIQAHKTNATRTSLNHASPANQGLA